MDFHWMSRQSLQADFRGLRCGNSGRTLPQSWQRQPTSPTHPAAACAVTWLSPRLKYYSAVRLLAARPFPLHLSTYRVSYPGATRERDEPSWGHVQIFRTVPFAHTLVRRVSKNAFASIVQAQTTGHRQF